MDYAIFDQPENEKADVLNSKFDSQPYVSTQFAKHVFRPSRIPCQNFQSQAPRLEGKLETPGRLEEGEGQEELQEVLKDGAEEVDLGSPPSAIANLTGPKILIITEKKSNMQLGQHPL